MDKLFEKTLPYLALTALCGVAVLRESSGNPLRSIFAGVNRDGQDNVFGIDKFLLFAGLGAVFWFGLRQGKRRKTDEEEEEEEEEEDLKRNIPELCVTLKEQVKDLNGITNYTTKIQELERKLKESEECKKKKEVKSIWRFRKQLLENQALEDKIRCLEDQKNLMEKQMAAYERCKAELEEKLLQMREENKDLKKTADEMARRYDDLNNQLAKDKCRIVQLQTDADKMHKNLCKVTEEKMEMEKHIKAQAETINRCKNDKEELQLKVEDLQKEVGFLSQSRQFLEYQLQGKDTRLRKQNVLLQERDGRLQEMEVKANAIDRVNNRLQDQLLQLHREKEQCLRDLENIKMQKKQQEEDNTRLRQQIFTLLRLCQLQGKDTRLRKQNVLLQERDFRLQEMEVKANAIDSVNNRLQDQLLQLHREKEQCLRDLENIKMQKKQQEETNARLQQQISVLLRWRQGVAFGLRKTDDQLANGAP
ncbi:trichohyalin-like [Palaemon carinicauda]|uniref:trichohyalin-like n=1 Tax=Palaemon carinicauda TaxID=392227 RepID=UPI0035B67338